jgi:HSP20 family protein
MDAVFHEIARRAYQIFENNGSQHGHDLDDWLKAERELLRPVNVEVNETDKGVEIKADVQGFNEKELEISVEPTRLTVTGKHEASKEETEGQTTYSASIASDMLRVIGLPTEVNAAKATATVKDGVLNVVIPKAAKTKVARVKPKVA